MQRQSDFTCVFYLSWVPGEGRQPIDIGDGTAAWIRAERMPTTDVDEALDCARPRRNETIMNTHVVFGLDDEVADDLRNEVADEDYWKLRVGDE